MNKEEFKCILINQVKNMARPIIATMLRQDMAKDFKMSQFNDRAVFVSNKFNTLIAIEKIEIPPREMKFQISFTDVHQDVIDGLGKFNLSNRWCSKDIYYEEVTIFDTKIIFALKCFKITVKDYIFDISVEYNAASQMHYDIVAESFNEDDESVMETLKSWNMFRNDAESMYIDFRMTQDVAEAIANVYIFNNVENNKAVNIDMAFDSAVGAEVNNKSTVTNVVELLLINRMAKDN